MISEENCDEYLSMTDILTCHTINPSVGVGVWVWACSRSRTPDDSKAVSPSVCLSVRPSNAWNKYKTNETSAQILILLDHCAHHVQTELTKHESSKLCHVSRSQIWKCTRRIWWRIHFYFLRTVYTCNNCWFYVLATCKRLLEPFVFVVIHIKRETKQNCLSSDSFTVLRQHRNL